MMLKMFSYPFIVIIEKCDLILIPSPGTTYFLSGNVEGPHFIHNAVKHDDDESWSKSVFFL